MKAAESCGAAPLSPAEIALLPPPNRSAKRCVVEESIDIAIRGRTIGATLRAYGRPVRAFRGRRDEPGTPEAFDFGSITLDFGKGEVEIAGVLCDEDIEALSAIASEDA